MAAQTASTIEKTTPPSAGKGGTLARAAGSFTVILATLLSTIYLAMWAFYPWRPLAELDVPGWIVDFADQVDLMMTKRNPPVVILGSSLTLAAPRRLKRPFVYAEELAARSNKKLDVCCMAVPGAIASDQDFILDELLEHGKKPSLVVYTYAPRDFMDNTIEGKISTTPTRRVLTFINRRSSFLPKGLSTAALSECFDNHAAFVDMVHRHILRLSRGYVCKISGHPESLYQASKAAAEAKSQREAPIKAGDSVIAEGTDQSDENPEVRKKALAADLELYGRRYNPLNKKRSDEQYSHLEKLLRQSQAEGIKVELVGMPVSPANLALLHDGVYDNMHKRISDLATRYGAGLYDFNRDKDVVFPQSEYLDSVHLSNAGAAHFVPLFSDRLIKSTNFRTAFPSR